jgi:hypothetical protein
MTLADGTKEKVLGRCDSHEINEEGRDLQEKLEALTLGD